MYVCLMIIDQDAPRSLRVCFQCGLRCPYSSSEDCSPFISNIFYSFVLDIFYLELLALSLVQAYLVLHSAHGLDLKNSLC